MTIALNRFRHDAANGTAFSSVRFFANVYYFFFRCLIDSPVLRKRLHNTGDSLRKKTLTLPRQNCNNMAVFAVTVYSVFTNKSNSISFRRG